MKNLASKKSVTVDDKNSSIGDISVDAIVFNPYQPRTKIDQKAFEQLCNSIQQYGLMQPIVVRKLGSGFELVAGERRVRAFKVLGMKKIPAVVRDVDDKEMAVLALVENLQRENLNVLEEAEGYLRLIKDFKFTQEEIADYVGRSQSGIANKLRLLRLPDEIKDGISREIINERQARALLRLDDPEQQKRVFDEVIVDKLNVEQTERLVDSTVGRVGVRKKKRAGGRRGKAIAVIRDIRIYLNSIREVVRVMRGSGLEVGFEEVDQGQYIEIVVKVSKSSVKTGRGKGDLAH